MASSKGDFLGEHRAARIELLAENISRERRCAAGVLFLAEAEQVGGVADLRFDFFLAIAEIVVGDDRDDHAAAIAAGQFESVSAVVELRLLRASTCRRGAALCGGVVMRQAEIFLLEPGEVRRQDHAAGVAGPVHGIQRGVVFGKIGSPPLPKMHSTKSRLLTRLPGAKKRVSMVLAGSRPVAGQTSGRSRRVTKTRPARLDAR